MNATICTKKQARAAVYTLPVYICDEQIAAQVSDVHVSSIASALPHYVSNDDFPSCIHPNNFDSLAEMTDKVVIGVAMALMTNRSLQTLTSWCASPQLGTSDVFGFVPLAQTACSYLYLL